MLPTSRLVSSYIFFKSNASINLHQSHFLLYILLQTLLKPIIAQIAVEPPKSSDDMTTGIPSVEEFDEILVSCLGQMAVTARSDVLWKPLNHEVRS